MELADLNQDDAPHLLTDTPHLLTTSTEFHEDLRYLAAAAATRLTRSIGTAPGINCGSSNDPPEDQCVNLRTAFADSLRGL